MRSDRRRITVNGIELSVLFFERTREVHPERRTLLLLHGFLDVAASWDLVAAELTEAGYDLVAPDLRGFGDSARLAAGGYYHFADYVADVDALVDSVAPEWLGVVGHSMGGGIAALYAGTRPEKVKRLAILEGLGPMADPASFAVARMRKWLADLGRIDRTPRPLASFEQAVERLVVTHPRIDRALLATRAELLVRTTSEGKLVWAYDPLHRTTSPMPFDVAVFNAFLASIACPTLFVSGGPMGWHPPDEAERLAAIPELARLELPEAGHMMHWTEPRALAAALVAHLRDR